MKKILVLFLAMMAVFAFGVCAIELDTAENAAEFVAEDAVLAADASVELKPGLNIYTGTTAAFDFEGIDKSISQRITVGSSYYNLRDKSIAAVSYVEFETKATASNASNMAIMLTGSYPHFTFERDAFAAVEAGRPVRLSFNYCSNANGEPINFIRNGLNVTSPKLGGMTTTNTNGSWVAYTADFTSTADATNGGAPTPFVDDTKDIKSLVIMKQNNNSNKVWIDDLSLVPYYKLSYDLNGGTGTVPAHEYFLEKSGSKYRINGSGTGLTKDGKYFAGWALTPDATVNDVVTKVTPELGKDVTVYAVYGKPVKVTFMQGGKEVKTVNTFAGKKVDASVSSLYTSAGADTWCMPWVNEDNTIVYNTITTFEEDTVLYAVERAKNPVIGENFIINSDVEGEGFPMRPTAGIAEIVDSGDSVHGKVIKFTRGGGYSKLGVCINWETGRKYRIEYDIKTPIAVDTHYCPTYGNVEHANGQGSTTANAWKHYAADYTYKDEVDAHAGDALTIYVNPMNGVENVVYYDNIKFIPYHKVTFNANGAEGTAPAVDFTLAKSYEITAGAGDLTKDGFYLAGWATSADGEVVESVDTVVGEDIELFAVWAPVADENAPESDSENFSMRAGDKAGMRFYASVTASQKSEATEYGFVVARADVLSSIGYDNAELKIGLEYKGNGEGKLYVKGAAYAAGTDLDKYITEEDGKIIFAAVCTGIDVTNKTQVTTQFVVRPYINIGGVYAYGKPVVKSLYEVAQAIDTAELPAEIVTYINTIIATAEAE